MLMNRNFLKLSSTTKHAPTVLTLDYVMRLMKIHGCDFMDSLHRIAKDAITILLHLGNYDEEIKGYAEALLNRFEAVKYE